MEMARMREQRDVFADSMKTAFMRGVCALNMEAMTMFRGDHGDDHHDNGWDDDDHHNDDCHHGNKQSTGIVPPPAMPVLPAPVPHHRSTHPHTSTGPHSSSAGRRVVKKRKQPSVVVERHFSETGQH